MVKKVDVLSKYLEFTTDMSNEEFSDWIAELADLFSQFNN